MDESWKMMFQACVSGFTGKMIIFLKTILTIIFHDKAEL